MAISWYGLGAATIFIKEKELLDSPLAHSRERGAGVRDKVAMQIIVDADACPRAVKHILYRAVEKERLSLTLVANTHIRTPPSPLFRSITVREGFDEADDRILEMVSPGDSVITADIPPASRVIQRKARALDPRGEAHAEETIGSRGRRPYCTIWCCTNWCSNIYYRVYYQSL